MNSDPDNILNMLPSLTYDIICLLASVSLILAYHYFLRRKVRKDPAYTVQAINRIARTAWVESVMSDGNKEVMAVQTLRNSTMAATFLASTAVLLIMGVLTLSEQGGKLEATWHALNFLGAKQPELWITKLIFLLLDLLVAFFSFSMSIRVYNHVGYMINVPLGLNHRMISPAHVALHLNRAGHFYSIGMRAYYFLVPLVFWLFGPFLMLASTVALLFAIYRLERAPKILAQDYSDIK